MQPGMAQAHIPETQAVPGTVRSELYTITTMCTPVQSVSGPGSCVWVVKVSSSHRDPVTCIQTPDIQDSPGSPPSHISSKPDISLAFRVSNNEV